ncbi:methyl-accepting chemotaxis protein [Devosia submarina]|nr:methyl-accepting chemotaxis protein [Devosia submarina]
MNAPTDATQAMTAIETSSGKISNIIGMIDDIAFQTNLLASTLRLKRSGH